ncbi:condensin subunit ScpA [Aquimonas voraii]|uniref:Segregation and condensation protein A n=1 Tax=Aquimonas voraii TaxID=265719 RepID=A0A1G6SSY2_9GAMM|nr:condensin subunit ScpA [Aquimonas voraii]
MSVESAPTADTSASPSPSGPPQQQEMPLAMVRGQPVLQIPQDLYIPPDALEVILDAFEGPLDLLLYLIRRQNLDILDIPVAEITRQYIDYIGLMQDIKLELAAEYLVMAAILAEIKSRLLLPRPPSAEGEEEDPRAELVRRLQEYERFRQAAQDIDALPRIERDTQVVHAHTGDRTTVRLPPPVDLREMLLALRDVLKRAELFSHHNIRREALSVRARMGEHLERLSHGRFVSFVELFRAEEGRLGVVVSFLAMLELAKEMLIEIVQEAPLAPIFVRALGASTEAAEDALEASQPSSDGSDLDEAGEGAFAEDALAPPVPAGLAATTTATEPGDADALPAAPAHHRTEEP